MEESSYIIDGFYLDLIDVMTWAGATVEYIAREFETDQAGALRLIDEAAMSESPSAAGPCVECGGTIRAYGRRLTCSPHCLELIQEKRWGARA